MVRALVARAIEVHKSITIFADVEICPFRMISMATKPVVPPTPNLPVAPKAPEDGGGALVVDVAAETAQARHAVGQVHLRHLLEPLELLDEDQPTARAMALVKENFSIVVTPHSLEKYSAVLWSRLPKYCNTPELPMKVSQPFS